MHVKSDVHAAHLAQRSGSALSGAKQKGVEEVKTLFPNVFILKGNFLVCTDCGEKGKIDIAKSKNVQMNAKNHVKSKLHVANRKKGASSSQKLTSFFNKKCADESESATNVQWRQLCHGMYLRTLQYSSSGKKYEIDASILLGDIQEGKDNNVVSWYVDKHSKFGSIQGTFRSPDCLCVGHFDSNMCQKCAAIPKLPSFRKRALLRQATLADNGQRDITRINNKYLTTSEMLQKLSQQKEAIDEGNKHMFFMSRNHLKVKLRKRTLNEKLAEFASRGNLKAVCHQIMKADGEGKLDSKDVLVQTLQTVCRNLHVKKQGRRYQVSLL